LNSLIKDLVIRIRYPSSTSTYGKGIWKMVLQMYLLLKVTRREGRRFWEDLANFTAPRFTNWNMCLLSDGLCGLPESFGLLRKNGKFLFSLSARRLQHFKWHCRHSDTLDFPLFSSLLVSKCAKCF